MDILLVVGAIFAILITLVIVSKRARGNQPSRPSSSKSSSNSGLDILFGLALVFFLIPMFLNGKGRKGNKDGRNESTAGGVAILVIIILCGIGLWIFH